MVCRHMSWTMRYFITNCVRRWRRRWMPNTLIAIAAFFGLAGIASAQTAYSNAPDSLLAGAPGSLVREEPMDGAPLGASTYRVLYRSTGLNGRPIFVSGVVIVPPGTPSSG